MIIFRTERLLHQREIQSVLLNTLIVQTLLVLTKVEAIINK